MAYGSVAITAGSGTNVEVFTNAGAQNIQVVRLNAATALTRSTWTLSTTASTSQIAADVTRVGLVLNGALLNARLYANYGSTAPTTAVFDWFIDPGDRYEVPPQYVELAVSVLGAAAGTSSNPLLYTMFTAA